ncbi:nuclear transport factor 2 family protein [Paeniroseomonas aquatica]|uniref:nuclear transport factor 2 family protein n=1 Tax=Paeniroseomonas aquatica TaxID=373043 RepID=UPI00361592A5
MTETETESLIRTYYAAFGHGDREAMLALLAEDVVHDVNQGPRERGKAAFRDFLGHMDHSYRERLTGLTIMVDASGSRAAAEFVVEGSTWRPTPACRPPAASATAWPRAPSSRLRRAGSPG